MARNSPVLSRWLKIIAMRFTHTTANQVPFTYVSRTWLIFFPVKNRSHSSWPFNWLAYLFWPNNKNRWKIRSFKKEILVVISTSKCVPITFHLRMTLIYENIRTPGTKIFSSDSCTPNKTLTVIKIQVFLNVFRLVILGMNG